MNHSLVSPPVLMPEVTAADGRDGRVHSSRVSDPALWVDQHGDYLFRYAMLRVHNQELAENLVQETFLAALKARFAFAGRSSERTWMVGILKHKIVDQFRKSLREKSVATLKTDDAQTIDEFYDAVGRDRQTPKNWMPDPEALLYSKEFWRVLRSCLECLPARTASAFIMRELDDRNTDDICRELEITPANLGVMLHRARLQLRALLEINWFEKEGEK